MKAHIKDYVGKRFGSLVVIGLDETQNHFNSNRWLFRCDCGKEFSDWPSRVISGHKKSCGCKKGTSSITHGCNGDEFYHTWWSMMQRCYNKNHHNYSRYGGRGITVCPEWHNPIIFIEWARETIGHKEKGYTLDRKNNDMGYSPDNCHWATPKEQAKNRRSTRYVTINGQTKTASEWRSLYGLSSEVVYARLKLGWSLEDAYLTPIQSKGYIYKK